MKFYKCEGCGNFITFLNEKSGCTPKCCGETMNEVIPNTTDAANEKHVPVIEKNGNIVKVTVGSVEHPMVEKHYIQYRNYAVYIDGEKQDVVVPRSERFVHNGWKKIKSEDPYFVVEMEKRKISTILFESDLRIVF